MVKKYLLACGFALITGAFALSAQAGTSPLVNGGFETGNFAPWTLTGNTGFAGVQCPGPGPTVAEGNCSAFLGAVGSLGFLNQSFAAPANATVVITFAWGTDGGTPSEFSVELDGATLFDVINPPAAALHFQTVSGIAHPTGGLSTLSFNERNDPGFMFLDAVSAHVPEPASLVLLALGLAGLGFSRRKKV